MPRPDYRYLRGWARYCGLDRSTLNALLFTAARENAPPDTYARDATTGKWLTVSDLEASALRGSIVAADVLSKLREYTGADPGRLPYRLAQSRYHPKPLQGD